MGAIAVCPMAEKMTTELRHALPHSVSACEAHEETEQDGAASNASNDLVAHEEVINEGRYPSTTTQEDLATVDFGPKQPWLFYTIRIVVAVILLLMPWIFYAVVVIKGQLPMSQSMAPQAAFNRPLTMQMVVTVASISLSGAVSIFYTSMACLAQKWVFPSTITDPAMEPLLDQSSLQTAHIDIPSKKSPVRVEYLGWLANLAYLQPVLAFKSRRAFAVSIIAAFIWGMGLEAPGGISAVYTPQPLTLNSSLSGKEVDLASTDPSCLAWSSNFSQSLSGMPQQEGKCGSTTAYSLSFITCLIESQLLDVIQAGRDNAFNSMNLGELPTEFRQMKDTRFLGSFPGVLLAGPNGLNGFSQVRPAYIAAFDGFPYFGVYYNYSLILQGLHTSISCSLQNDTPLQVATDGNGTSAWTGSCPTGTTSLSSPSPARQIPGMNVGVWICKQTTADNGPLGYSVFLTGTVTPQGNGSIACTVNATLASYEVEYLGVEGYFQTITGPIFDIQNFTSSSVFSDALDDVLLNLGYILSIPQSASLIFNVARNLVSQANGPSGDDSAYLSALAAMSTGMVKYIAGYYRFLFAGLNPPDSCFKDITGKVSYPWLGWSSDEMNPLFMVSYTLISLFGLIITAAALLRPERLNLWKPLSSFSICRAAVNERLDFYLVKVEKKECYGVRYLDKWDD